MPRCSIGRIVHVHSSAWSGARAGMIVGGPHIGGTHADLPGKQYSELCDVEVHFRSVNDAGVEVPIPGRSGNVFGSIPVFEEEPRFREGDVPFLASEAPWPIFACFPPRVEGERIVPPPPPPPTSGPLPLEGESDRPIDRAASAPALVPAH